MSSFSRVPVDLGERSYSIWIGPGAISQIKLFVKGHRKVFVVCDRRLTKQRKALLQALRSSDSEIFEIPVRAGESLKDMKSVLPLYGELLKKGASRDSCLVALGGGSVGDAAGFVASTYLRGIPWISVPTTLLAQVDSGVGGKTAVNHELGKNLIGTFFQPSAVICDLNFLKTLSRREMTSGFGETLKYGLIYDPALWKYVLGHWDEAMKSDPRVLGQIVRRSLFWKSRVVSKDEFDKKGLREALNFGHTFGHALESLTQYQRYQHGEAVLVGMRFALALSHIKGFLSEKVYGELDGALGKIEVPKIPEGIILARVLKKFTLDKKNRNGRLHFVLLRKIGKAQSVSTITPEDFEKAYQLFTRRRA